MTFNVILWNLFKQFLIKLRILYFIFHGKLYCYFIMYIYTKLKLIQNNKLKLIQNIYWPNMLLVYGNDDDNDGLFGNDDISHKYFLFSFLDLFSSKDGFFHFSSGFIIIYH